MRWLHSEEDVVYGESNLAGVDKEKFINEFVDFLKTDRTYKIFVLEENEIVECDLISE